MQRADFALPLSPRSSWSISCDPEPAPEPCVPELVAEDRRAELDALLRAMPPSRLLSNGMEYADVQNLRSMAAAGVDWVEAGTWLAERNLRIARKALATGHQITARTYFRYASACFRFAQNAVANDTEIKKRLYRSMVTAFSDAAALDDRPIEHWSTPYEEGWICAWLMRPSASVVSPLVIVLGGFDGWREEHYASAAALVERGISALLVDMPGQGETRLFHRLFLRSDVHKAFSRVIDVLAEDARFNGSFGIWGNSFGGCLAAKAAIADKRLNACCVNGGASRPLEFPERYPRFYAKVEAMIGSSGADRAAALLGQLDITASLAELRCSLLQLHSENDPVFSLANARQVHDLAGSPDKTLLVWADGDHCLYNHASERNCAIGDWFCERMDHA
jgi:alpha-beta hydrolase superfamily lysophospholipase